MGNVIGGDDSTGGIVGNGNMTYDSYNKGNITGKLIGGIAGNGSNATNCHNMGDLTGGSTQSGEITAYSTVGSDCSYLQKEVNASPRGAQGKNEEEMAVIMDIQKFVNETLNTTVKTNNETEGNTQLLYWELENGKPVFKK